MVHKKVWNSQLFSDPRNVKHIDVMLNAPRPSGYVAFRKKYEALEEIASEDLPTGICFKAWNTPQKEKDSLPDMFLITLGLAIVSERMHDLLRQFNLGRTRFHEVPFYEYDRTTQFRG